MNLKLFLRQLKKVYYLTKDNLKTHLLLGDKTVANAILTSLGGAFDRHIQMAETYAASITV